MVQINWTKQAQKDLKNIADFIANDSVRFARIQINKIRNRTKILKEHPLIGRIVPEFKDKTIRELIEKIIELFTELNHHQGLIFY